jgi:hypothetical protein
MNCKTAARKATVKKSKRKKAPSVKNAGTEKPVELTEPELPAPLPQRTRTDKELGHLAELYPDEFVKQYQEELDKRTASMKKHNSGTLLCETLAFKGLLDKLGIQK